MLFSEARQIEVPLAFLIGTLVEFPQICQVVPGFFVIRTFPGKNTPFNQSMIKGDSRVGRVVSDTGEQFIGEAFRTDGDGALQKTPIFIYRERVCFKCLPGCSVSLMCKECVYQEVIFAFAACKSEAIADSTGLDVEGGEELNVRLPIGASHQAVVQLSLVNPLLLGSCNTAEGGLLSTL